MRPSFPAVPLAIRCGIWLLLMLLLSATQLMTSAAHEGTPADRYEVNLAADTVLDRRTGLTWQRSVAQAQYNQADGKTLCTGLSGGWRLPSFKELLTLVDPTRANPSIDPVFANTPAAQFWTDTADAQAANRAWMISFADGRTVGVYRDGLRRVRCVR